MSNTTRLTDKGFVANVKLDREEAHYLANLIENDTQSSLLRSCAEFLREYSNRRRGERRKKK